MNPIRTLVVDDVGEVRQDLCALLSLFSEVEIVGQAADGLEAIEQEARLHPQVVLMDLEMPGLDGYQATLRIKSQNPACRVIALTVHGYAEARQKAFQSGVDAFIIKGAPVESLVGAIVEKKE
jgi:DNA-binding NarL/FixJ family response regulator